MRILLISANALHLDDGSPWRATRRKYSYAATTLSTLAALVPPELGAEVVLVDEAVEEVPEDFAGADLVGISAMTCDAPRAYGLADQARRRKIPVVLGGYHATFLPGEAAGHADAVVRGFAEASWPSLLRDFRRGSLRPVYEEPWREAFASTLPTPRRDLIRRRAYTIPNTLEASRGCPHECSFCVVPPMHAGAYVFRNLERLAEDVSTMPPGPIALLDPNPFEDRERAAGLLSVLERAGRDWFTACSLQSLDDGRFLESLAASRCRAVVIGFESLDASSLARAGKSWNDVARYGRICRAIHDHGIAILGCFVFGFDGEDHAVFERTAAWVDEARIELVLYSVFTPFPGTPAWTRLSAEGRILTTDWSRYDGRHVVFQPEGMTADELQAGIRDVWRRTYGVRSILRRVVGAGTQVFVPLAANLFFRHFQRTFRGRGSPAGEPRASTRAEPPAT